MKRVTYDSQADAMRITLDDGRTPVDHELTEHEDDVIVKYSKDRRPVSIELLNASRYLPRSGQASVKAKVPAARKRRK